MTSKPDWTEQTFDQTYIEAIGLQFSQETTSQEVNEVVTLLGLKPGMTILDLACGHGRHSLELARRGLGPITGLDFSQAAIDHAKFTASAAGFSIDFLLKDMRKLELHAEFDAVINLGNSMFYWDEATHQRILEGVWQALKPGGCLCLDAYNPYWVATSLALRSHPAVKLYNRVRAIIRRVLRPRSALKGSGTPKGTTLLDVSQGLVHGVRRMTHQGHLRESPYRTRLYTLPELRSLLERAGFEVDRVVAEHGKTLGWDTPRVLLVARKLNRA
jgi:2-polyprenyl-3-methyl-5-hydroxy-6-metoxy-1,4-benzoquinol methylase